MLVRGAAAWHACGILRLRTGILYLIKTTIVYTYDGIMAANCPILAIAWPAGTIVILSHMKNHLNDNGISFPNDLFYIF